MTFKRTLSMILCAAMLLGALVVMPIFGASAATSTKITQQSTTIKGNIKDETGSTHFKETVLGKQMTWQTGFSDSDDNTHVAAGDAYYQIASSAAYAVPSGAYAYKVTFHEVYESGDRLKAMFVRGTRSIEFGDGGYYGQDGNGSDSFSNAGIYLLPVGTANDMKLRVTVKTLGGTEWYKKDNKDCPKATPYVEEFSIEDLSISVYDDGTNIRIYAGDTFVVGFAVYGSKNYTWKDSGDAQNILGTAAETVNLIRADGTTKKIDRAIVADGYGEVGVATRTGAVKFESLSLASLSSNDTINRNVIKSNLSAESAGALSASMFARNFSVVEGEEAGSLHLVDEHNGSVKGTNDKNSYRLSYGEIYTMTSGAYKFEVDFTDAPGVGANDGNGVRGMFVRGDRLCAFGDGGYYGMDGNGSEVNAASVGNSGIYMMPVTNDGILQLRVTVKTYNDGDTWTHDGAGVPRATYWTRYYDIPDKKITVYDDGENVTVYAGGEVIVTMVISGKRDCKMPINGSSFYTSASTVTMVSPKGESETINNACVSETCVTQVGVYARSADLRFTSFYLDAYKAADLNGLEYLVTAQRIYEKNNTTNAHDGCTSDLKRAAGYVTLTSIDHDPQVYALHNRDGYDDSCSATGKTIAIKYRIRNAEGKTIPSGQLYVGNRENTAQEKGFKELNYISDGQWRLLVVDVSDLTRIKDGVTLSTFVEGRPLEYIRFDFINMKAADYTDPYSIDIAYIGIFATAEQANAYEEKRAMTAAIDCTVAHTNVDVAHTDSTNAGEGTFFFEKHTEGQDFRDRTPDFEYHQTRLGYRGWLGLNDNDDQVGQFGYRIDGGIAVYNDGYEDNTADDKAAVDAAAVDFGGTYGQRFYYTDIDISDYAGTHTIDFVYRPSGTNEDIVFDTYIFTLKRPDTVGVRSEILAAESNVSVNVVGYTGQKVELVTDDGTPVQSYDFTTNGDTTITLPENLAAGTYRLVTYAGDVECNSTEFEVTSKAALAGSVAGLKDKIVVKFYMDLDDTVVGKGAYVHFTLPNGLSETMKVPDTKTTPNGSNAAYYQVSCDVAAKEMAGTVTASLRDAEGNEIRSWQYTVKAYAAYIIESTGDRYTDEEKALAKAMLNYGAAAQQRFNFKTHNLANDLDCMSDADRAVPEIGADTLSAYAKKGTIKMTGLAYYGTSTVLESSTYIRHYFTLTDGANIEDYTFKYTYEENGTTEEVTVTPEAATGTNAGKYYVDITGIVAKRMDRTYTLTVSKAGEESQSIEYSVYSYIYAILSNPNGGWKTYTKEVVTAAYHYCEAAQAAFDKQPTA